jgi:chitinase
VNPTNGTVFIAPANFTVLADAQDVDGTVTNVQFFYGTTNFLGETFLPPYGIVLTNVPVGSYSFSAIAADNLGASGTSAPVSITVIASPPLSIMSAMSFNPQTDLFQQTVRVSNPTSSTYHAVRVYVYGLTNNTTVYNASGSTNGIQYVESLTPIAPGG